jgi:hypothetical protein
LLGQMFEQRLLLSFNVDVLSNHLVHQISLTALYIVLYIASIGTGW